MLQHCMLGVEFVVACYLAATICKQYKLLVNKTSITEQDRLPGFEDDIEVVCCAYLYMSLYLSLIK